MNKYVFKMLPSLEFETGTLTKKVLSCAEAARSKMIPLKNELKTLVLNTSNGVILLNLPGDKVASLRKVKNYLHAKEAYIAGSDLLCKFDLEPGRICPFHELTWRFPQLVSTEVFDLEYLSTNNGTYSGFIVFGPKHFLRLPNVSIGDFCRE